MNCSFLQSSHIQVAIYDDRLEITSPGGLLPGVTLDKMKEGYSEIRNRALAHAFSYMNLIEAWGSGIPKLMASMQEYGLREPEFMDLEIGFRINLYRSTENVQSAATQGTTQAAQGTTQVTQAATRAELTEEAKAVLRLIQQQPDITQRKIAAQLGWKVDRVKYYLNKMKRQNIIRRVGTSQTGHWELLVEDCL